MVLVPQRMRSALHTNFILQPLIDKTTKILRSGAARIKIDEGDPVECKIVIFLPLAGGFERRWRGGGVRL